MKILIKIENNKLLFYNRKKLNSDHKNMLNTNVISNDQLVFSDEYIKQNTKLVISFINELIKNYDINSINFQNNEVTKLIIPFINKLKYITNITIESNEIFPYKFYEILHKNSTLQTISAEYIPQYIFEAFDKCGILPESRNEILFTSNFMEINGLNNYSSIYYKSSVYLYYPIEENDLEDFKTFCKINNNLKTIIINVPTKLNLEELIYIIKEYCHKKIKLIIHGDVKDESLIKYLKKNNKLIEKKYKIKIKLKYTDKYIKENIVKETNNNILQSCAIIMLVISFVAIGYVAYDSYKSKTNDTKYAKEIQSYIKNNTKENNNTITNQETNETNIVYTNKNTYDTTIKNDYLNTLKEINNDVVGWIKVKNTNIDYSVLQSSDNKYYLNHNIYKKKDSNGWIFMNYTNNNEILDDNTVLFGHNRYINGVMFGTLNKTLNKKWYENEDNLIIDFDTLYGSYKFKIFSIYIIKTTSDYLTTSFDNAKDKINFLNMIKDRSINNFNIELNENSKIITLSTCNDETSRLVVHAVLIEEN